MTIAIVDDFEPDQLNIAEYMKRFLGEQGGGPPQFVFYSSGEDFIEGLSLHRFDLVLLDCCMEGLDGIETARELRRQDRDTVLVFITSCRDYAVDGYLVSASGYLVKPFTYEDFSSVMSSAGSRFSCKKERISIMVPNGKQKNRIWVDDIVYCDTEGHYIQFHHSDHSMLRVRMTFAEAVSLLNPYVQLLECYRGCIINMDHIHKAEELSFLMDTGERVPLRRKEQSRLLQKYSDYIFDKVRSECR